MKNDYEVKRCTRVCAVNQRELRPGESFYSVLRAEGGTVLRDDYSMEAWQGPPDHAIGWWKSRMPERDERRARLAPNDQLLQLFQELHQRGSTDGGAADHDLLYVLALLLVRRRVLRLEETTGVDENTDLDGATAERNHVQELVLYCPRQDETYHVAATDPDERRIQEIQDQLATLLYADAA